jgi:hypothetical protein
LELHASSDIHANEFTTHEYDRYTTYKQHGTSWSNYLPAYFHSYKTYCTIFTNLLVFILQYHSSSFKQWPGKRSPYSNSLRTGWAGNRIRIGARFCVPVQSGHRAHPASCTGYRASFRRAKRPGHGDDGRRKERVELYLYHSSGPSWPVLG